VGSKSPLALFYFASGNRGVFIFSDLPSQDLRFPWKLVDYLCSQEASCGGLRKGSEMAIAGIHITTNLELVEMPKADYDAVSTAVGGYIEHIRLEGAFKGFSLYVHEEGKLLGLPFNDLATAIWEASYGRTDVILGNAVLVSSKTDDEGNELPLTDAQAEAVLEATRKALLRYGIS
jgi:hypothetical protein